ncbi:uncharacterized protein LOC111493510 [Cucurbita maxima]|uniref:Uncharacterized protein LOC111493510 n=1 Tax=Cucurbita maxima TaxID=3661 RepID=A0A6J1KBR0_CUCMA|nr:uncharacterized protein LOC111493510 [Cucurbita maxima]
MEIERLEKEVTELSESSFSIKQKKEENGKVISELVKKIKEGVEKQNDLLMEVDGLVEELVREEKDVEMLTQQRDSLDVNLNRVQQEVVSLRRTIEIITHDKAEMEEAKVEVENVIVDLRRELSKLKEAITSLTESSEVEKGRNEELLSQMGYLREALNGVSLEKDKLSLLLEDKERKLKKSWLSSRKQKRRRYMTPQEAWSGRKTVVDHFRIFGCIEYAHIPDEKRKKLEDKSLKCVFLGVSEISKPYKLYDSLTKKVVVSCDVIFDEKKTWT